MKELCQDLDLRQNKNNNNAQEKTQTTLKINKTRRERGEGRVRIVLQQLFVTPSLSDEDRNIRKKRESRSVGDGGNDGARK